jgi:hypothetical protein
VPKDSKTRFLCDESGGRLALLTGDLVLFGGTRVCSDQELAAVAATEPAGIDEASWSCPTSNKVMFKHPRSFCEETDYGPLLLEVYHEVRIKPAPASPPDNRALYERCRWFRKAFQMQFTTNKHQGGRNPDDFRGAALDLSFCLPALGPRRQLNPLTYQRLLVSAPGKAGTAPLKDPHGVSAFIRCDPEQPHTTAIKAVYQLVETMFQHQKQLNEAKGAEAARIVPDAVESHARRLVQVCDAMFPTGVSSLEQLTRGLMAALLT